MYLTRYRPLKATRLNAILARARRQIKPVGTTAAPLDTLLRTC
jgi:hypothetical protein